MTEELSDENVKEVVVAAVKSLARCEQSRSSLEKKLRAREFSADLIEKALDFLEENTYLDDSRYAASWIQTHCISSFRGTRRLLNELLLRGVSKTVAENAVREYFETHDEEELCQKAYEKFLSQKKDEQKIIKSLADSGFSYKMIQTVLKKVKNEHNTTQ